MQPGRRCHGLRRRYGLRGCQGPRRSYGLRHCHGLRQCHGLRRSMGDVVARATAITWLQRGNGCGDAMSRSGALRGGDAIGCGCHMGCGNALGCGDATGCGVSMGCGKDTGRGDAVDRGDMGCGGAMLCGDPMSCGDPCIYPSACMAAELGQRRRTWQARNPKKHKSMENWEQHETMPPTSRECGPLRAEPDGFRVHHLSRSVTVSYPINHKSTHACARVRGGGGAAHTAPWRRYTRGGGAQGAATCPDIPDRPRPPTGRRQVAASPLRPCCPRPRCPRDPASL